MPKLTFPTVRDVVLLLGGLAILAHEVFAAGGPRTELLTIAAGMIGLPATFLADRKLKIPGIGGDKGSPKPPSAESKESSPP